MNVKRLNKRNENIYKQLEQLQTENKRLKELCKKALKVLEIRSQSKNLYYPSITINEVSVLQALSESQKGDE